MANTAAGTLITRALDYAARSSAGVTRSGTSMEDLAMWCLNAAMFRISKKYDFREMYKTYEGDFLDGDKTYTFPVNFKVIRDIRVIDGSLSRKLKNMNDRRFDEKIPYPENWSEDMPVWYIPHGNLFDVYPIPDATYTGYIRSIQWPTVITATATLIDYEPNKDDVILAFALTELFGFLQMLTDSTAWEAKAALRFKEAKDLEERMPDWDPKGVGFDSGGGVQYIPEDTYNTTTSQWIVNPFLLHNL